MARNTHSYEFRWRDALVGVQTLFVAFGALVLVPILTGLDAGVALFTAGSGTLLFQVVTRGRVPIFLGSSFAFIAPIIYGIQTWGLPATLCGLVAAGFMYVLLSLLVRLGGLGLVHRVLPPIVTGPVIMVIGIILAPVAVNMAMGKSSDGAMQLVPYGVAIAVAAASFTVTVLCSLLGRGLVRLVSILVGIGAGYALSAPLGLVDLSAVSNAAWFRLPPFVMPEWNLQAVLFILPVAIAPVVEHFGDVVAIGSATERNYVEDPGIHRTLLGDGLATMLAACLGGPPNTTYSEVTGSVVLTRVYNPAVMTWAAIAAITLAFVGKLGGLLQTIPIPVMGGVLVLLFGAITVIGLNTLVQAKQDLLEPRNMAVVALILISGVGGLSLGTAEFSLKGVGLAAVLGVAVNLVLPGRKG